MRKLLLAVGATAVVVGGGAAVADHYDQYKNKQHADQVSAVVTARRDQYNTDKGVQDQLAQANATLKTECEKGATAYARLPLSVQKVVPKPICASPTAQ